LKPVDAAVEWLAAREKRERLKLEHGKPNIFAGGSVCEISNYKGIPIVRLSVWPKGATKAPFSYAVDIASGLAEEDDFAQSANGDGFEDFIEPGDRRGEQPAISDEDRLAFELASQEARWQEAGDASLPFNLQWQQTGESRFDFFFDLPSGARCFGLGERNSGLNLRSSVQTLFNTDDNLHIEEMDMMYKSIPFLIVLHQGQYHGLFLDSPARQRWNLDESLEGKASIELLSRRGWQLYAIGPASLPDLTGAFTMLTGRSKMPPLWSLGHQQSRWSYPDQETVIRVAHEFRSRRIPCDTIVLDIDYMDEYRVFTHSPDRFADFRDLIFDLEANHFKVVTIVDPGVKKDPKYFVFTDGKKHNYFCHQPNGKLYLGKVWAGESAFPDFLQHDVRLWWAANHGFHTEMGVAGIWNDMNEPAIFDNQRPLEDDAVELPPESKQPFTHITPEGKVGHLEVRNLYGFQMSRATFEGLLALRPNIRPFVLSRSGYAGIQRYAAVWLGDNHSWWEHLAKSIPMLLNVGLSGVPFCGVDIGGFQGDTNAEILVRWYELGIFYPLFRNHCWMKGQPQEPWSFSPQVEEHCRKLIETRYRLLPLIESLFFEHSRSGAPLMRPLVWEYPDDPYAPEIDDQFFFGKDILVAPILERGKNIRSVYLPEGLWHPFEGGEPLEGGRLHLVSWPLGSVPAFVRDGAVIPLADPVQHTVELASAPITFVCFGDSGKGTYYEDDGISFDYESGCYNEWLVRVDNGQFRAQPVELGFDSPRRQYRMSYGAGKNSKTVDVELTP
jgi:alpha-glucosidase